MVIQNWAIDGLFPVPLFYCPCLQAGIGQQWHLLSVKIKACLDLEIKHLLQALKVFHYIYTFQGFFSIFLMVLTKMVSPHWFPIRDDAGAGGGGTLAKILLKPKEPSFLDQISDGRDKLWSRRGDKCQLGDGDWSCFLPDGGPFSLPAKNKNKTKNLYSSCKHVTNHPVP